MNHEALAERIIRLAGILHEVEALYYPALDDAGLCFSKLQAALVEIIGALQAISESE